MQDLGNFKSLRLVYCVSDRIFSYIMTFEYSMSLNKIRIGLCLLTFILSSPTQAEIKDKSLKYEDRDILVRVFLRSPDQIQAFYEGREFPKPAIEKVKETCNIAVIIKNKSNDVLWLILDKWNFISNDKPITRLDRSYWLKRWDEVNLSQAHRSTFGWTLLPEVRDLRPDEGAGGSVTVSKEHEAFDLALIFPTGKDKNGPPKSVDIKNIQCTDDNVEEI